MGTPGPAPEVTLEDTLGVFADLEHPSTPLTASEVAEELNCARRTAHRKLDDLAERGDLETKKPGAHSRIWWRPDAGHDGDDRGEDGAGTKAEFADFVAAVEDYAIFTLEPDGTVATWNAGARRIKGYEEADIVGEHFSTFYTDEDTEADVPEENLATAAAEGRVEDEGWRVCADGSRFWANVDITAIRDDDGELQGFTKVTRDMTDRREYEHRLERERNRTEEVLATAPSPIILQDENGETVMANERAQMLLGLSEAEIVSGPDRPEEWAVYDANDEPLDDEELAPARADATGEPVYDQEIAIENPDGERTWFSLNATPFSGPGDEEGGVVLAGEDVTTFKERQRELETELSEILGRISDAFYAVDDEWRFTHLNARAKEIIQQSGEDLVGREVWEVFPDARDGVYWENLHEAMEAQEPQSFEVYESGIDSWLEFTAYPSESGLSIYFQDVTDRKERERELTKYETIVETMNDGIYVKDAEGYFTMVNETYAEMTGYEPEALVGEHASLVVDEAAIEQSREVIADQPDEPTLEALLETADGEHVPTEGTFASLDTGEEVGVVRDVSRRKARERELERYRTIVETVEDGIYTVDDEGRFSTVNDAYVEMTGYDREELLDSPVTMVVDETTAKAARDREADLLDGNEATALQAEMLTAEGERFPAEATFGLLPGEDGDHERVGVVRDVTERVRRERELERYERIVENVPVGVYRNTPGDDGEFVEVNEALADIFDADSIEEFTDYNVSDLYTDPDERAAFSRRLEEEGIVRNAELEQETLDGRTIWISVTAIRTVEEGEVYFDGIVQDVTERHEYEQELRTYEVLFKESRDVSGILAPDGTFRQLTPSAAGVLGYEPAELEGENAFEYVHPEDRERAAAEYAEMVEDPAFEPTIEYRFQHADGSWMYLESRGRNLLDDPDVGGIVVYSRDVTERREREQRLQERERQLSTLMDNVPGMVYRCRNDPGWPMEFVSEGCRELTGYDPHLLERNEVSFGADVVHEDDREQLREEVQRGVETDGSFNVTYRIRTPDGDVRWVRERGRAVPDEDGEQPSLEGVIIDVTDRKRTQQRLTEERDMFAEGPAITFRWIPDTDAGWPVEYVSDNVGDVLGYEPEEFVSGDIAYVDLLLDEELEQITREISEAVEAGRERFTHEPYRVRTDDGDVRWVKDTTKIIRDDDGDVERYLGYLVDVTERMERERELEQSRQRYRALVDNFPNGAVALVDHDLRYQTVGGTPIDEESHEASELEGEPLRDAITPELADALEPRYREALTGNSSTFQHERDDAVFWVRVFPVRDDEGSVIAAMGMSQDVTEQVERERELEDAKSRLEAAMDAGAVGTWEWDVREDSFVANPAFARTFGVDPDAASEGVSIDRFTAPIHEDDRERVTREIQEAVDSCGEYEAEYRVWNADGDLRWVVARGHVECDDQGEPVTFPGALTDITERKAYQRKIEESERRYRALVENFPNGAVGLFDDDLRYTAVGGQFLERADVPQEARIGERVSDIYPDALVEQVEPYFEAALHGETNSFEAEYHDRQLFARTLPVTDADGEVIAGMLVVQDVTERREAQRELRESEAKFRMLAENLEEIVWMATPEAEEFVYVNPAFEDVWGFDRELLYEESFTFTDAVHPDDRGRVEQRFGALPEEDFDEEFRIVRPDDEVRWIHARGARVSDDEEEFDRVVGIGEDITDRVERERELERTLDLLAKTQRIADVGGWEIDPETTEVFWSDHLFEILGIPNEEEPQLDEALDVYHEDDRATVEDAIQSALETGDPFDVEVRFRTPPGEIRWLRVQGDADTEDSTVVSLRGAAQDVTERVQRQQRLETLIEELEESNERLERFAYVASHDLQEPLRMISNYLQLLERRYRSELDEDAKEFIDFAVDGAERMRDMIGDLLAYSRLDTEAEPLEPTDVASVAEDVLEDLHLRIDETDADVTVGDLPTVDADEKQLEMVFQNLVSNALKYSGDDPPDVEIDAHRRDDEWAFTVADEGIGMDPERTDDVFEVFNRLHTHEEYPGTGIGLAMCKKIVHRHGGDIWVDSEPGAGSTFTFTIPEDASAEGTLGGSNPVLEELEGI